MMFTTLAFLQVLQALATRSNTESLFTIGVFSNRVMWGVISVVVSLQLVALYTPLGVFLGLQPLTAPDLLLCIGLGLALIGLGVLMRQAGQEQVAEAVAFGVVLIGLLTALNTFGRTLSEGGLTLSQPIVISVATTAICSLYLALWNWEHSGQQRDERPQ